MNHLTRYFNFAVVIIFCLGITTSCKNTTPVTPLITYQFMSSAGLDSALALATDVKELGAPVVTETVFTDSSTKKSYRVSQTTQTFQFLNDVNANGEIVARQKNDGPKPTTTTRSSAGNVTCTCVCEVNNTNEMCNQTGCNPVLMNNNKFGWTCSSGGCIGGCQTKSCTKTQFGTSGGPIAQ